MANDPNIERYQQLLEFMRQYDITRQALAERLGFKSVSPVNYYFRAETCPSHIHAKMLEWGFPPHLLPRPDERRKDKTPRWDELRQAAGGQPPIIP